jgi:hypothetical protein
VEVAPALRFHELEDDDKSHCPCQAEQGGGSEDTFHGTTTSLVPGDPILALMAAADHPPPRGLDLPTGNQWAKLFEARHDNCSS